MIDQKIKSREKSPIILFIASWTASCQSNFIYFSPLKMNLF